MANWVNPKYNWVPNDGIANTDFNRIEENTQWLYDQNTDRMNTIILSGNIPCRVTYNDPPHSTYDENAFATWPYPKAGITPLLTRTMVQTIRVIVPIDYELILVSARYALFGPSLDLPQGRSSYNRLFVNGGSTNRWVSSNYYGDESPYALVYNNVGSGAPADILVSLSVLNVDPDTTQGGVAFGYSGWTLRFLISESTSTTSTTSTTTTTTAAPTTTTSTTTTTTTTTTTIIPPCNEFNNISDNPIAVDACNSYPGATTVYGNNSTFSSVTQFYSDNNCTTPLDGGDNWYSDGTNALQVNSSGQVISTQSC